jgi:hypothetical protein
VYVIDVQGNRVLFSVFVQDASADDEAILGELLGSMDFSVR